VKRLLTPLAVLALGAVPGGVAAQGGSSCDLVQSELAQPIARPDGTRVVYVVQPLFRCAEGSEIRADSAVLFEATGYSQFFRNVFMRDGTRLLQSDQANYQDRLGRLDATGNVRVNDSSDGTRLTGTELVYLQAQGSRTEDVLTIQGGQPTALFTPAPATDSTGARIPGPDPDPVNLRARLIVLVGERLVQARGQVRLTRDSLNAYGDSLSYDQDSGDMTLFRNARIIAPQSEGDSLDLRGDTIITQLPGGRIERIEARRRAVVLGGEVEIRGPIAHLFFTDEEIDRVVATIAPDDSLQVDEEEVIPGVVVAPRRPVARSESYEITGDSLDILTPGGTLETVFAAGMARAVSSARDSINTPGTPDILTRDWVEGDSIRAFFEPMEGQQEAEDADREIRRLVATGNARSLSRFLPDSINADQPDSARTLNANYVTGSEIRVFLSEGEVQDMEVDDADGIFLQPAATARIMNPDSTVAVPDTTRPDTTGTGGAGGQGVGPAPSKTRQPAAPAARRRTVPLLPHAHP